MFLCLLASLGVASDLGESATTAGIASKEWQVMFQEVMDEVSRAQQQECCEQRRMVDYPDFPDEWADSATKTCDEAPYFLPERQHQYEMSFTGRLDHYIFMAFWAGFCLANGCVREHFLKKEKLENDKK